MLTTTDIQHCLRVRSILCSLKLFPLKVDLEQRRFLRLESKRGISLCVLLCAHYVLRMVFVNFRFVEALLYHEYRKEDLHLLTWDMVAFLGGNLFAIWYVILFIQKPHLTVCVLNQAFSTDSRNLHLFITHAEQDCTEVKQFKF